MTARALAPLLALASLAGCGGAQDRPEPPSGAVDPGVHGLVTPGTAPAERAAAPQGVPALSALRGLEPAAPAASGHAPAVGAAVAEARGKMVMTREHCEALGRKFAELTLKQGGMLGALGVDGAGEAEAAGVGRTFSERCARDLAGQEVEVRDYQCMLRAESPDGLLACKK